MDPQALAPLYLLWNALAVLGILSGLVLALAGYRVREHIAQLPGLVLGVLIAGGLAYLLWRGPLPTIVAAALGGWAGAAIIRAYRDAILFASGAWVGLLVALAIAAVLALLMQQIPAPWVLLLLFVIVPVVGGLLAKPHERLMVTLATAFTGAGLIVGGLARLSLYASGGTFDANLIAAMLFGSLVIGVAGVIVQYRGPRAAWNTAGASDRSDRHTDGDTVFHNPRPPTWDRPYPEMLPEAIRIRDNGHGGALNSRWVTAIAMASDGSRLAAGALDGSVYLIDCKEGHLVWAGSLSGGEGVARYVTGISVGREGGWVATAGARGVHLWNPNASPTLRNGPIAVEEWGSTRQLSPSNGPSNMAVSSDERWFITSHGSYNLWLGQMSTPPDGPPQLDFRMTGDRGSIDDLPDYIWPRAVAFHPRGNWILVTDQDFSSRERRSRLYFYDIHSDEWYGSSGFRPGSCTWGWANKEPGQDANKAWREASYGELLSAYFSRNMCANCLLAVVSSRLRGQWPRDGEIARATRMPRYALELREGHSQLAVAEDGSKLGVLCEGFVRLFKVDERSNSSNDKPRIRLHELRRIEVEAARLDRIAFSPDGRLLATSSRRGPAKDPGNPARVHLWNTNSGRLECELISYEDERNLGDFGMEIDGLVFHPNGRWLFSGGSSGLIRRWTLTEENGNWSATCDMAMEPLPDGNWVVWRDPDGPNRCWVNPSTEAQRWLGWRMPSGGDFAEYRPFDAYQC